ncbi:hypothetical protein CSKR_102791, partial [Clonorchis sinensis]
MKNERHFGTTCCWIHLHFGELDAVKDVVDNGCGYPRICLNFYESVEQFAQNACQTHPVERSLDTIRWLIYEGARLGYVRRFHCEHLQLFSSVETNFVIEAGDAADTVKQLERIVQMAHSFSTV